MQLNLIIQALELIARREEGATKPVYFAFCHAFPLLSVKSSRCYYERPAIDWAVRRRHDSIPEKELRAPQVHELLALLKTIPDSIVHGYKGGEYIVDGRSSLHVDGYGECTGTTVDDVIDHGWCVTLETKTRTP